MVNKAKQLLPAQSFNLKELGVVAADVAFLLDVLDQVLGFLSELGESVYDYTEDHVEEQHVDQDKEGQLEGVETPIVRVCVLQLDQGVPDAPAGPEPVIQCARECQVQLTGIGVPSILLVEVDEAYYTEQVDDDDSQHGGLDQRLPVFEDRVHDVLQLNVPLIYIIDGGGGHKRWRTLA